MITLHPFVEAHPDAVFIWRTRMVSMDEYTPDRLGAGIDRQVLQEEVIPDDGFEPGSGLGPPGRCRLSTRVERPGIYALNITVSQDRYGEHILWGFRTNCPRYLVETSRGHRDARHLEPIVLRGAGEPDIWFAPRPGPSLNIEVTEMYAGRSGGHGYL